MMIIIGGIESTTPRSECLTQGSSEQRRRRVLQNTKRPEARTRNHEQKA
jgi:hypothetical protein